MPPFQVLRAYLLARASITDAEEHVVQFAPESGGSRSSRAWRPARRRLFRRRDRAVGRAADHAADHQQRLEQVPGFAAAFRRGLQASAVAEDRRIVDALARFAEERHEAFRRTYPSIAARVPLKMLASYLGMTPETLSRVRRPRRRTRA